MTDYQGEKFKEFLKSRKISVAKASDMLNISRQAVYEFFKSGSLKRETVNKILDTFKVSVEEIWDEARFREDLNSFYEFKYTPRLEAKPVSLADPEGFDATGEKIYELPDGSKIMEVKVVPIKSQAGYLHGFPDPEFYEDLPTLKVSVNNYHKGSYLAFEVQGDSMTPTDISLINQAVLHGWFVIAREVARHHWKYKLHTHSNSKWVIVHKTEGILIKQIIDHDIEKGTITVHSLNPKYEDQVLNLDDCEQIFNVVKTEINER